DLPGRQHHRAPAGRQLGRLPVDRRLLRVRARHRARGPTVDLQQPRLLPVRPFPPRLGHGAGVHLRQPRRGRDHGDVGQRRAVRHRDRALLLDRRRARDAVPRRGHDAVLLRLEGPVGPGVHAPEVRHRRPPGQRAELRDRPGPHRRHQPVPARHDHRGPARLEPARGPRRGGRGRAHLHRARRPLGGDLQRGAAVLRHRGRAAAADDRRPEQRRRLGRAHPADHRAGRRGAALLVAGHRADRHRQPGAVGHRPRLRPRLRAVLRLLDDELRRGPAGDGEQLDVGGAHLADHRRLPEDVHPLHRHHPGDDRRRRRPGGRRGQGLRRGLRLQQLLAVPHAGPAPQRHARPGDHRVGRLVHGGHGGQHLGLQHGLLLRPVADLRRQGPARRLLPEAGAPRDGRGDGHRDRHRAHRLAVHQPHELPAGAVRLLQRPAVRDLHPRDVLEADDGDGRVGRPRVRHAGRGHGGRAERGRVRVLQPRRPAAGRTGCRLRGRRRRVRARHRRERRGDARDQAARLLRAEGVGLLPDAQGGLPRRRVRRAGVVPEADPARRHRPGHGRRPERGVLV
ncbi:MAG: Predicted sodium-dependent galactose transporter, partial [uncultured Nocardioidaceae bacterium]